MRFFFYGTLAAGSDNPVAKWLHPLLHPGEPATARGCLYAIPDHHGWYPGMIPDPNGAPVHGFLHEASSRFGPDHLAALDRYEEFDPRAPDDSEFLRLDIAVFAGPRRLRASAYVLRKAPDESAIAIADGCFAGFVGERGLRAFGAARSPHGG